MNEDTNEKQEPVAVGSGSNEGLGELLPDDFSESKDWKYGGIVERVEWLKDFHKHHKAEIARLEDQLLETIKELEVAQETTVRYRKALEDITELSGRKADLVDAKSFAYAALDA